MKRVPQPIHHIIGLLSVLTFFFTAPNNAAASTVKTVQIKSNQQFYFSAGPFLSLASDADKMSNASTGLGWYAKSGWRHKNLGIFIETQRDFWVSTEQTIDLQKGVINVGVGIDYLLFKKRLKMSFSTGTSTLLFDAIFHDAGTTGVYTDIHPSIIRWSLTKQLILEFSPLSFTLVIPALSSHPKLIRLEYRTSIGLEVSF